MIKTSSLAGIGKFVAKHPLAVGIPVALIAGSTIMNVADRVHDTYNIWSEQKKRGYMREQLNLLSQIRNNGAPAPAAAAVPQLVVEPLY